MSNIEESIQELMSVLLTEPSEMPQEEAEERFRDGLRNLSSAILLQARMDASELLANNVHESARIKH